MDQPQGTQNSSSAESANSPALPIPSAPNAQQHINTQPADAPKDKGNAIAARSLKDRWSEFGAIGLDRQIELILTLAITFFACVQLTVSCSNNASTSSQTNDLIKAAQMSAHSAAHNAAAAQSFSESASSINKGISDAVVNLQNQSVHSGDLVEVTRSQGVVGLRPFVYYALAEQHIYTRDGILQINISPVNYGRSPALHMVVRGKMFTGIDAISQAGRWFAEFDNPAFKPKDPIIEGILPVNYPGGGGAWHTDSSEIPVPPAMKTIDYGIVVAERIRYADIYGNRYQTDYCGGFLGSGVYGLCPSLNDIK